MESSGPHGDCVSPVMGRKEGEGGWWIGVKWAAWGLCKSCHEAYDQNMTSIMSIFRRVHDYGRKGRRGREGRRRRGKKRKGEGGREREGEREGGR